MNKTGTKNKLRNFLILIVVLILISCTIIILSGCIGILDGYNSLK